MDANQRLKETRERLNISQAKFAEALSIYQAKIADIEKGKQRVTPDIAKKIEEVYNVNLRWLLFGEGNFSLNEKEACKFDCSKCIAFDPIAFEWLKEIIIKVEEASQNKSREWSKENKAECICKAFKLLLEVKKQADAGNYDKEYALIDIFFNFLDTFKDE